MRIFKPLAAFVVGIAFLACLNVAITFALEPYGSKSELAWTDYAQQDEIDTVIVGSSLAQNAISPQVLDELYGSTTFSLATPNQSLEESLIALKTAYEDHGITRAILGVSLADLQASVDPPSLGSAFLRHRGLVVTPVQNLEAAQQVLLHYGGIAQSGSINALFPWFYNHVTITPSGIADNVRARLGNTVYEAAAISDPSGTYIGRGYYAYDSVLDYDSGQVQPFFSSERQDGATSTSVDEGRARVLEDLSAYCDEKGIKLVAVSVPLPAYDVVDGDSYYELHDNVVQLFSELGCGYRDFNFARPELFESRPDYFLDTLHMNAQGSRVFTGALAHYLELLDAGEDVDSLFCDEGEQRASIDYISTVFADASVNEEGLHVVARAVAGAGVNAEYQLCAFDSATGEWAVVHDWTPESQFDYEPSSRGVVSLRVNARESGSQAESDHYRVLYVYY